MNKSILFRILAIITGVMMLSFTLISCGDDDGNKGSATFFLQAFLNDGSQGASYGSFFPESTAGTTIGGKDMERFLEKYRDADIFVRSFEINQ